MDKKQTKKPINLETYSKAVKTKQGDVTEIAIKQKTVFDMVTSKANKVELIRTFGDLSLSKILKHDFPTIGQLKKIHGLEKIEVISSLLISDLSASFDRALDSDQIMEITVEITSSNLRNLTLEDLYLVCRTIKSTDSFGKLTINKVLKSLTKHYEKRIERAGELSYNNHISGKHVDSNRTGDIEPVQTKMRAAQLRYLQEQSKKDSQ